MNTVTRVQCEAALTSHGHPYPDQHLHTPSPRRLLPNLYDHEEPHCSQALTTFQRSMSDLSHSGIQTPLLLPLIIPQVLTLKSECSPLRASQTSSRTTSSLGTFPPTAMDPSTPTTQGTSSPKNRRCSCQYFQHRVLSFSGRPGTKYNPLVPRYFPSPAMHPNAFPTSGLVPSDHHTQLPSNSPSFLSSGTTRVHL